MSGKYSLNINNKIAFVVGPTMLSLNWLISSFLSSCLVLPCWCSFCLVAQNHEPHPPLIGFEFVYFPAADFRDVSSFNVELLGNAV